MTLEILSFLGRALMPLGLLVAEAGRSAGPNLEVQAAESTPASFQAYIFWSYGLVCLLLLGFTLWTYSEARSLGARVDYLKERFRKAHPDALGED